MSRIVRAGAVAASLSLAVVAIAGSRPASRADEPGGRDLPPAFAPLEYLVGQWNGQAIPRDSAQSFRGWPESHTWAWTFVKGKPAGLSVSIRGGKVLAEGKLTFDPGRRRYRLEGTAPGPTGHPLAFEGTLDASGKLLALDRVDSGGREASDGALRLSFRPNSNFIRYTMWVDRKEAGAARFHRATEIGLTKAGESLAGGSTASERARCIVTGGAATMTVSYQGRTFPICCSGCRDEFQENPEKYIKKASLIAGSRGKAKAGPTAPAQVSRFEDAFSGDVADMPSKKSGGRSTRPAPAGEESTSAAGTREAKDKPEPEPEPKAAASSAPAARAASLLRIGQNLEKSGKTQAALANYRRIVKDYADTPAAGTAKKRIEAIGRR